MDHANWCEEMTLANSCFRRFRWVSLQLDYLCTLHSEKDVSSRLGRLPRKLGDSYEEIWAQKTQLYEVEDMTRLGLALSLLLVPNTPTPAVFARFVFGDDNDDDDDDCTEIESNTGRILAEEQVGGSRVCKAMRNDPLVEMVTKLCFGLVIFDITTNSFRFAHTSVQEYIMSRKDGFESLSEIHARIAKRCMCVLVEPETVADSIHAYTNRLLWPDEENKKRLSTMFPTGYIFDSSPSNITVDWVSRNWAYHVENSKEIRQSPSLIDLEARLRNSVDETPWESLNPSVFFSACIFDNLQLIQRWLNSYPKLALLRQDVGNKFAPTALHHAACAGIPEPADYLINAGADLNAPQYPAAINSTPLHFAISRGSLQVVRLLLQYRRQKCVDHCSLTEDITILRGAIWSGREDVVHALLDHGFSPSGGEEGGLTPLAIAIENNVPRILKMMIDRGASVYEKSHPNSECGPGEILLQMPLLRAIHFDEIDDGGCVRVLLKAGADPRAIEDGFITPLGLSTALNRKKLVQILIEFGADVNDPMNEIGQTPLFKSIDTNNDELTKLLLAAGADPNITDVSGATALMVAPKCGNDKLTKLLLAAGANPNITRLNGHSALHAGADVGNLAAVKTLLAPTTKLTSSNIQSIHAGTALSRAAEKGYQAIVETLLDAGAEISPQDPGPHCSFMNPSERKGGFANSALVSALFSENDATFRTMLRFSAKSETRAMKQEIYDKVLRSLDEDGWDSFDALNFSETVPARFGEYRSNGKTDEEAYKSLLTTAKNPFCHFSMTLMLKEIEKYMQHKDFIDQTWKEARAIEKQRKEKLAEKMKSISKQEEE